MAMVCVYVCCVCVCMYVRTYVCMCGDVLEDLEDKQNLSSNNPMFIEVMIYRKLSRAASSDLKYYIQQEYLWPTQGISP